MGVRNCVISACMAAIVMGAAGPMAGSARAGEAGEAGGAPGASQEPQALVDELSALQRDIAKCGTHCNWGKVLAQVR